VVKWPSCKADHTPLSGAEVKNDFSYTALWYGEGFNFDVVKLKLTATYIVFVTCCL
jgi:hypothetical protein